jgi:hypothetical protein
MPGGAAALERDFSIASNVLTVHRAQLDPACVEMTMLLHMNMDKMPPLSQIPELSRKEREDAVPRRLRNKKDLENFQNLDVSEQMARRAMRGGIGRGVLRSVRGRGRGGRRGGLSERGGGAEERKENRGEGGAEGGRREGQRNGRKTAGREGRREGGGRGRVMTTRTRTRASAVATATAVRTPPKRMTSMRLSGLISAMKAAWGRT